MLDYTKGVHTTLALQVSIKRIHLRLWNRWAPVLPGFSRAKNSDYRDVLFWFAFPYPILTFQIKGGGYPSFGDFDRDLKLMWENCRLYNSAVS